MRILHVTSNYPSAQRPAFGVFVRSQVESLRAEGVTCDVLDLDGRGSVFRYLRSWFRLIRRLLTGKYDVIHAHHALSGILLCLSLTPLFRPCVLSYQNSPRHEWGKFTFRLLYPFFKRIILKAPDASFVAYSKIRVLPNGCSSERFRPMDKAACKAELGLEPSVRYILFIDANIRRSSKSASQKREDRFDEVIRLLEEKESGPVCPVKLVDAPPEQMPLWYNASELYLLTSDFEGSPNAVKECLMCNVPVVATPVGDLPFLGHRCPGCYVSKSFEAEELAERACLALKEGAADGPASRDVLLNLGYGLEDTAGRLIQLYSEIV